jgi:hypothetical protein
MQDIDGNTVFIHKDDYLPTHGNNFQNPTSRLGKVQSTNPVMIKETCINEMEFERTYSQIGSDGSTHTYTEHTWHF